MKDVLVLLTKISNDSERSLLKNVSYCRQWAEVLWHCWFRVLWTNCTPHSHFYNDSPALPQTIMISYLQDQLRSCVTLRRGRGGRVVRNATLSKLLLLPIITSILLKLVALKSMNFDCFYNIANRNIVRQWQLAQGETYFPSGVCKVILTQATS